MPVKKQRFEEIKKGVVWEIEGMNALEIAKQLTADNLTALYEQRIFTDHRTLKEVLRINSDRSERSNNEDVSEKMWTAIRNFELKIPQTSPIAPAIVNPKRIRSLMKSDLWQDYKDAFHKEHIQLVAKEEAAKFVNRTYPSKNNKGNR